MADPAAHVFNGRLYIYPSHDIESGIPENDLGDHFDMRDYHVLSMDSIDGEVKDHGVILDLAISANISLASLDRFSRAGAIDFRREQEVAADYTRRLGIKTPSIFAPVTTLSGGNQQKVALSRWLVTQPSVLILDEPTQGIDVGAKAEVHALMTELASQGVAILMISSELPEILGMSDRVAVMHEGSIVATLDRAEATQEKILALALGH